MDAYAGTYMNWKQQCGNAYVPGDFSYYVKDWMSLFYYMFPILAILTVVKMGYQIIIKQGQGDTNGLPQKSIKNFLLGFGLVMGALTIVKLITTLLGGLM